jgi:hypothetical protein
MVREKDRTRDRMKDIDARNKEIEDRTKQRRKELEGEMLQDGQSITVNMLDVSPEKIEEIAGSREGDIEQVDIQTAVSRVQQRLFEEQRDLNKEQEALTREQSTIWSTISTINSDPDETPATTR